MYEKSDRLCPKCYRWLRIDRKNAKYFCPDTIRCQLRKAITRPPEKVTLEIVQEQLSAELSRSQDKRDTQRVARLREALDRWI